MKRLSSAAITLLWKIVFPVFWISGFGYGTVGLWMGSLLEKDGTLPPAEMKWVALLWWVIGTPALLWSCVGLKHVRYDATHLYISNFLREIAVPLTQIVEVTESRMINFNNLKPVTIHFRDATAFGHRITFLPLGGIIVGRPHPIIAQLQRLAGIEDQEAQRGASADGSASAGLRQPRG